MLSARFVHASCSGLVRVNEEWEVPMSTESLSHILPWCWSHPMGFLSWYRTKNILVFLSPPSTSAVQYSSKAHTLNCCSHLLDIVVLLSKVGKHVTIVTIDIPAEDFDVALRAELVDPYHQVSGTACQTHLRGKKHKKWKVFFCGCLIRFQHQLLTPLYCPPPDTHPCTKKKI